MTSERLKECFNAIRSESAPNVMPSIDAIQKYVRELEADKARLDWLHSYLQEYRTIAISNHPDAPYRARTFMHGWNNISNTAPNVREAIDNAKGGE